MKEKPYFNLFASAVREEYYEDIYNSAAANNDIPFEMVFAGNKPPTKTMPDNFRYIYSEGTPSNCWEIAARASEAELMIWVADDVWYSKNFLNRAYYYSTIFDLDKIFISFRYGVQYLWEDKEMINDECAFFNLASSTSVTLGIAGIYRKDLWMKTGGIDKRFYGIFADLDLMLRFYYEFNMNLFVAPDCVLTEGRSQRGGSRLSSRSEQSRLLLNSLWYKDGVFSGKRLLPVESF